MTVILSNNNFCPGDSANVDLGSSQIGVSYQLRDSITDLPIGVPIFGTGAMLSLPTGPVFSNTSYNVLATDTSDMSTAVLDNTVSITVLEQPSAGLVPSDFNICLGDTFFPVIDGHALRFNGTNQEISVPHSPILEPTAEITVEAWVKGANWAGNAFGNVVVSKLGLPATGYALRIGNSGVPSFTIGRLGFGLHNATPGIAPLSTGVWHHLVGTYDGISVRLYVNGILASTNGNATGTIESSTGQLKIGRSVFAAFRYFDGEIDEVRIWNKALDANQILARKDQVLGGNETGLLAYYDMNYTGQGLFAIDRGPNGFIGTLINHDPTVDWIRPGAIPLTPPGVNIYAWAFGDANTAAIAAPEHVYANTGTYSVRCELTYTNGCTFADSNMVTVDPLPVVDLGPDTSYCGGPAIILDAGNPGATYLWSTAATSQTISVIATGQYFVTVTNANLCSAIDSVNVTAGGGGMLNLGADTTICTGQSLTLDAGPWTSYLWSNTTTAQTITISTAGTYYVDVLDGSNCSGTDSIVVVVNPIPVVSLGADSTICIGQSLMLDAGSWASYLWSNASTMRTISVATAGTYYVDVFDGANCIGNDTILVAVAPLPVVDLGPDTSYCGGPPIVLDAGNPGATYLWSSTATSQTISVSSTGQYFVTVTNGSLCSAIDSVNVTTSGGGILSLGPDTTICAGQSLTLDAGPWASYLWSTGATVQTITLSAAGTYYIDVLDTASCSATDTIVVAVAALPVVNLGSDTILCTGAGLVLDAGNPGATYLWSDNSTGQQLTVTQAGTYDVTVTNAAQCSASDTLIFSNFPANNFSLGGDTILCIGQTLPLDVSAAGVSQIWSTGATTAMITVNAVGIFWVDVLDANGCTTRDSIAVGYGNAPQVTLSGLAPAYCQNDPVVTLSGLPGGGTFFGPGIVGATFDPGQVTAPDTVQLIYGVAPPNQCEGRDTVVVIVRALPTVNSGGLTTSYCTDAPAVALTGNPIGGQFSGPGVAGLSFMPAQAGAGQHNIAYAFTDGQGCTAIDTQSTEVLALPQVSLDGLGPVYCADAATVPLIGLPAGGNFSGPGVAGNDFDPAVAGGGTAHTLIYTFTDGNGCQGSDSTTLTVDVTTGAADAGLDQEIWLDNQSQLAAVPPLNGQQGAWTIASGAGTLNDGTTPNALISDLTEGTTVLEWTLTNGACTESATVRITKRPFEEKRGFSPNGDGKNDFFVIEDLERFPNSVMIIRSRWGEVILQDPNYTNDWNGSKGTGEAWPDDTYFFDLQVANGSNFKGFVMLRR